MDVCNETPVATTDSFPAPPSARRTPSWPRRVQTDYAELTRFWPVVQNMVMQELHVRYQRSFMGFMWTLINPLLMMMTLSLVFSNLLDARGGGERYSLFILAGMVPWTFMAGSLSEATACIVSNEVLIRKIYIPKLVFPLVRVLINLVTTTLSMGALFILLVPLGARPCWPMLLLPVAMALYFAFTLGLCLLVATTNTFFRDCATWFRCFSRPGTSRRRSSTGRSSSTSRSDGGSGSTPPSISSRSFTTSSATGDGRK